jgi:magnesium transporter
MKLTGRVMRSNSINGGVVDNAIYVDGVRTANPATLDETYELLRERHGIAWIGLYRATSGVIGSVAAEFGLHHLVFDDAIAAHQRPKLERYGAILFTVLRSRPL